MKLLSIRPSIWIPIIVVLLGSVLGWGAWASLGVADALPEVKFEQHERENNEKFDSVQRQLVDKLDDIQKTILDLHKK
jgi:hypothetical protein